MNLKAFINAALLIFCFNSCFTHKSNLGLGEKYFPATHYLKDGIVNKYYFHLKSDDGYDSYTNIEYHQYLLTKPDELVINKYNPAFELTRSTTYLLANNKMLATQEFSLYRGDTTFTKILLPTLFDWEKQPTRFESAIKYETGLFRFITIEREFIKDTLIHNKAAQILLLKQIVKDSTENKPPKEYLTFFKEIYLEGIGLYGYEGAMNNGYGELELIEQISGGEFNEMANHNVKRVGYIDPAKKLDKNDDFNICGSIDKIVDYYNSDPDANYIGGKKALWSAISPKIIPGKLRNESGYLTYRFVINCQGKIGWFITEEAGLDFKKKQFSPETVNHLLDIVSKLDKWQPAFLWGNNQDAYFYLTFKLKDGEIIELLP
jgi:hypothetical protein